ASNALIEYVKQGRQPGCSLVFATQQPSAIDTKVLSQLDIIIAHKLVFDDDIKAVFKRTPTIIPKKYKQSSFIKTLPVGTAIVGDRREETSRAFVIEIRPRMSQHEGREAVTSEIKHKMDPKLLKKITLKLLWSTLERDRSLTTAEIESRVELMNKRYSGKMNSENIIKELIEMGAIQEGTVLKLPEVAEVEEVENIEAEPQEEIEEETIEESGEKLETMLSKEEVEMISLKEHITKEQAIKIANKKRKKKFLGLVAIEHIDNIEKKYIPIYRVELYQFNARSAFTRRIVYVNSFNGEFIHVEREILHSKFLPIFLNLTELEAKVLKTLLRKEMPIEEIAFETQIEEIKVLKIIDELQKLEYVVKTKNGYKANPLIDVPLKPDHPLLSSLEEQEFQEISSAALEAARLTEKDVEKLLKKLWPNISVKSIRTIFLPVFKVTMKDERGEARNIYIEAVSGTEIRPLPI
ncbi:MAG: hypothetical protein J7L14_03135, partial [Candidatus Diapherotrites archaeon]|nr:hypothetical protein [Candidatus Diapherotrites archaeon]